MRYRAIAATMILAAMTVSPRQVYAQQPPLPEHPSVAPQIELDGEGVATLEGHWPRLVLPGGARGSSSRINVSDSALLLGASQRLYRSGIGSLIIGGTTTEENGTANGTNVFSMNVIGPDGSIIPSTQGTVEIDNTATEVSAVS